MFFKKKSPATAAPLWCNHLLPRVFWEQKNHEIPKMKVAATTVDGSEILRAPVKVGSWNLKYRYLRGFIHHRCKISSINSTTCWSGGTENRGACSIWLIIREIFHKWRYPMKRWNRNALIPGKPYILLTRWDYAIANKWSFLSRISSYNYIIPTSENPMGFWELPNLQKHH